MKRREETPVSLGGSMDKKIQANILKNQLKEAANAYYNSATPIMTDEQYDYKLDKLHKLEEELNEDFGSNVVGAPILKGIRNVPINPPMLSLEKCHSAKEILDFAKGENLVATAKCDGVSTRLIYKNGKLISANTRGNGIEGADITEHIKYYTNVPLELEPNIDLIIDGETVIKNKDFEKIKESQNLKNSRNAVAGTLMGLDVKITASRKLSFIAWDIIEEKAGPIPIIRDTIFKDLVNMADLGFEVVPWQYCFEEKNIDDINQYITKVAEDYCSIPTDGVVWKINNLENGAARGKTAHHFKSSIAFKPEYSAEESELLSIDYDVSRQGILTPVAVFKPIIIDGTEVSRASLSNMSILTRTLGTPFVGQKIRVIKANKIIPMIVDAEIIEESTIPEVEMIHFPKNCPICGKPLEISINHEISDVERLVCINENCDGKLLNRIDHFFGKKGLNVKGLSKATIEKILDWGWADNISDIFHLRKYYAEWINKNGFGKKSVENILSAIDSRREITISELLSAAGIPKIGMTVSKKIEEKYPDWDNFKKAAMGNDLIHIDGIGDELAYNLRHFDYSWLDNLIENKDVTIIIKDKPILEITDSLKGQSIVITGKLQIFKRRADLEQIIRDNGGTIGSSITGKTTILINNDSTSTSKKNLDAKAKGVPIMTEPEFIEKFQIDVS